MCQPIPDFDEIIEHRRYEKAEALRLARAGVFVHESELVYADDVNHPIFQGRDKTNDKPITSCPHHANVSCGVMKPCESCLVHTYRGQP